MWDCEQSNFLLEDPNHFQEINMLLFATGPGELDEVTPNIDFWEDNISLLVETNSEAAPWGKCLEAGQSAWTKK